MKFMVQHTIIVLILFFATNIEAFSEEMYTHVKPSENVCECWTRVIYTDIERERNDCTSCFCISPLGKKMEFSQKTTLPEFNVPVTEIEKSNREPSGKAASFLTFSLIPVHITKISFPFLQVVLA
ncbi:MAG: hypothetical protein R6U04_09845 [Bacteroidales bacterium]